MPLFPAEQVGMIEKSIRRNHKWHRKNPQVKNHTALSFIAGGAAAQDAGGRRFGRAGGKDKIPQRIPKDDEDGKPGKLADAIIRGGDSLYEVYHKAARTAKAEGHQRTASEIDPESIKQKKGTEGLVPGLR